MCRNRSNILDYWRAIEFFLPQKLPKFNPNDKYEPVYTFGKNDIVSWNLQHKIFKKLSSNNAKKLKLRHVVYAGTYSISEVREQVQNVFGKEPQVFDEYIGGESCLFSILLTQDGRPLFDSFVLSMCGWALGRLKNPGPENKDWLENFEEHMGSIKNYFEQRFAVQEEDKEGLQLKSQNFNVGRSITMSDLLDSIKEIQKTLNLEHLKINTHQCLVKSVVIHEKNVFNVADSDFLNSFYIKDLKKISAATSKNKISTPLFQYLEENVNETNRIDIRKLSAKEKLTHLAPNSYPKGCWPSKGFYPLVYAQQFSVNTIKKSLDKEGGIFSVNGPPGTGKTTLLRDLIAAVVVERAIKLSECLNPTSAFEGEESWKSDSQTRSVKLWKKDFCGFEMVVASSNNSAVENVTLEIPAVDAIDPLYGNEVSYFSDIATELLDKDCWALLTAKLGNKNNRNHFKNKFWAYPERPSHYNTDLPNTEKPSFYKTLHNCVSSVERWESAVKKFKLALTIENELRQQRQNLYEKYQNFTDTEQNISVLEKNNADIKINITDEHEKIESIKRGIDIHHQEREKIRTRRQEHIQFKPTFIDNIFSLGKAYQNWRIQDVVYQTQIINEEKEIDILFIEVSKIEKKIILLKVEQQKLEKIIVDWLRDKAEIEAAKLNFGANFPDTLRLDDDINRELSSPWMDDAWFQARVSVFLEALNLHRAFIEVNAPIFVQNLKAAMDILSGKAQNAMPTKAFQSAWATFFFVVPVVSTTFASFDKLFPHYDNEISLGWLFIDEAGQATPQAAVGGLWRSKRVVAVGDPLQLEPILTVPITVQEALKKHFIINDIWLPKKCSVQSLSDRVNTYGTYLKNENGENLWIGSPLRVHRRCENPMFEISNRIAYDGMMVFGTPLRENVSIECSNWFHIEEESGDGHWIEAEGVVTRELIRKLYSNGISEKNIAIISPFTAVVKRLYNYFPRTEYNLKIGTIHTMQGKEADVVILVLGGDPKKPGAKDWASEKPNLLNVAVSRSKARLYVVGNRISWGSKPYFRQLSQLL